MHDLIEAKEKLAPVKELKEQLLNCVKNEISCKGLDQVDTSEAGEVVDMIKDLAKAEKDCMEALYYEKVTEAMLSYETTRYGEENMGYNPNRNSRTGEYMSGSHGTRGGRMGYVPYDPSRVYYDEQMGDKDHMRSPMMGYTVPRGMTHELDMDGMDSRYGRAYNKYKMARRHYTETKNQVDRKEMSTHAEEHMYDVISTVRDIWEDADPSLKKRMKEEFSKLLGEMN